MKQLQLFDTDVMEAPLPVKRPNGGSNNPIVFHDYESYIAKFRDNPKTTDDTYTPSDVYDAILKYVGEVYDMTDKVILRPFYPGGDYENAEYPENGVVIDNPPFSIFTNIVKFYSQRSVPFFLFGPGLTIMSCCKYCTAVIVANQITFENGAFVRCNFATNLMGDAIAVASARLSSYLDACPSQKQKVNLPSYAYPEEIVSTSDLQTIARGDEEFYIYRSSSRIVKDLDLHPKKGGLFGDHLLTAKAKAKATAKAKAKATATIHIRLSKRERAIVEELDEADLWYHRMG